jgi:hypothetical protein
MALAPCVVAAQVVRLMRPMSDRAARRGGVGGMAAPAVAAAVGHISVRPQIGPARGEALPVGEGAELHESFMHGVRLHEGIAILCDGVSEPFAGQESNFTHVTTLSQRSLNR